LNFKNIGLKKICRDGKNGKKKYGRIIEWGIVLIFKFNLFLGM
jgi:hypothetical protein